MTTFPNNPVFPETMISDEDDDLKNVTTVRGLTIREHFAGLAMQAMITGAMASKTALNSKQLAISSVFYADALIEELNGNA